MPKAWISQNFSCGTKIRAKMLKTTWHPTYYLITSDKKFFGIYYYVQNGRKKWNIAPNNAAKNACMPTANKVFQDVKPKENLGLFIFIFSCLRLSTKYKMSTHFKVVYKKNNYYETNSQKNRIFRCFPIKISSLVQKVISVINVFEIF